MIPAQKPAQKPVQPRHVIQLVTRNLYEGDAQLIALCSDGSMLLYRGMVGGTSSGKWVPITEVQPEE